MITLTPLNLFVLPTVTFNLIEVPLRLLVLTSFTNNCQIESRITSDVVLYVLRFSFMVWKT